MKSNRKICLRSVVSSTALAFGMVGAAIAVPQAAHAQAAASQRFEIAPGDLAAVLQRFSADTGIQLIYASDLVAGKRSAGVSGDFTSADALSRLLADTGLMARVSGNSATIISIADGLAPEAGERVTGAVRVEGAQGSPYFGGAGRSVGVNGTNGSRDITATEGTGSFTSGALTIGSKVPQAMKDVPQSISVLTAERMEQQNTTDFTTAMRQLPGISLVQGASSLENTFYSRGFKVQSIQIDGGAPLNSGFGNGQGFFPQIDMSQYDHVELLRGAAGLLNGYGDPGGIVNLVRKKPLDHAQVSLEAQAGSWNNYRLVADLTSPLAFDGKLRGRLVMTYQDRHYFYDIAKDNKKLIYGIVEFDATPTTLLTAGGSYTKQDSVPWFGGLPRFQTGADLKLPRSTALAFPWNRWDFETTEFFGGIEQKIGGEWTFKLNLTHNEQESIRKVGYSLTGSGVNPLNNGGPGLQGIFNEYSGKQFSADTSLSGAFEIFGQRQEITVGANRVKTDAGGMTVYQTLIQSPYQPYPGGPIFCGNSDECPPGGLPLFLPPINVFDFDPFDRLYSEPPNPLAIQRYPKFAETQYGAYINMRLTAFDRLHLTTGLRWSRYQATNTLEGLCTFVNPNPGFPCFEKQIGDVEYTVTQKSSDSDFSWPPSVNLSFDITRQVTAYFGYTDIYISQSSLWGHDHKPIDPVTGSNVEAGIKWAARDGRLNVSLAAYRIKQKGFGTLDFSQPIEIIGDRICCFINDPMSLNSKGFDIEATGEILRGWQIATSYTFSKNIQRGDPFGSGGDGLPFVSIFPKHLYKLWTSFDFGASGMAGWISGLTISGGINGQSAGYNSGFVCTDPGEPNPITGISPCNPGGTVPFRFKVLPYTVFSGRVDYRLSDIWSVSLNIENIFDKVYYQTTGTSPNSGHWYGAPRNFTLTARAKW